MILRFGALLIITVAILIMLGAVLPDQAQDKIKIFFLSDEQKSLFTECEKVRRQLKADGISTQFYSVELKVRDQRLEQDPILKDLNKCFSISKKSENELAVEVFSSDYEGQTAPDLQVQMSILNIKSQNKIAEVAFRIDHKPMVSREKSENEK